MNNPSLVTFANYLDSYLGSAVIPDDQNGIYHPSERRVRRIGLALEPWAGMNVWVQQKNLDALFLHRPWHLDPQSLPADIGILAYHLAFDFNLTLGFNRRLADTLQMTQLVPFAYKNNLPLGMLGTLSPVALPVFVEVLAEIFGVRPTLEGSEDRTIRRIAIVGAMNDSLIRDASSQDADLYITGQFRQPARAAVNETGMLVAVIGHTTCELWGLRALAGILHERWATLEVVM